ncbi:MAG: HEAT repeat domain-containing protein, partial [Alphaproteobacteria bacterium]|nr:HEAT repeat domain-containing protein [Alphaproteobacteria bacterium]
MTALPATSDNTAPRSTGATPPDRVCARLSEILREGADVHRTLAAQALGAIGRRDAVPALLDALLDEDADVRVDAAAALGSVGDPSTAPKLMDNLIGDPCAEVKMAAMDALIAMRHEAIVPWLIRLLKGRDEEMAWDEDEIYQDGWDDWVDMQVKAIEGLAAFGISDAVPDVIEA